MKYGCFFVAGALSLVRPRNMSILMQSEASHAVWGSLSVLQPMGTEGNWYLP